MKCTWLLPILFASGCMVSNGLQYEAMSETNQYHLAKVRKGMSQSQVLKIMHKPYSYENFQVDDEIYDVWFYVTRPTGLDQTRMVPQNLTPLTFKNGVLVGTGYQWYYYAMKEQARAEAPQKPPPVEEKKPQEVEDKEFEQSLKNTQQKKAPSKNEKLPPNVHIISQSGSVSGLKMGMTEEEVSDIMGSSESQESFTVGEDVYDVWFYQSKGKKIPLTFKNGRLVGKTQKEYEQIEKPCKDCYDEEGDRLQEEESEQNFNSW